MSTLALSVRRLALVATLAVSAACDSGTPTAVSGEARVTMRLLTSATIRSVVVEISGPGLEPPVVVNVPIRADSVGVDTLVLPAGAGRRFLATAFDTAGVPTHRADTTITLVGGNNTPLLLRLKELESTLGLTVTFAGASVTVPDTTTRVMQVGDTLRIAATGRTATGALVTAEGLTWGATNPAILSVAGGLVTARRAGVAAIAVGYAGATVRIPIIVEVTPGAGAFQLAPNGVTVLCPVATVGATGVLNGVTYTKRSRAGIDSLIAANNFAPLETTCTSGITDMRLMFYQQAGFNTPIGSWDVSSVTTMSEMFYGATGFNQPIGDWDVGNVANMTGMFRNSTFNQPIGNWNVSSVSVMGGMFTQSVFNQPIGDWDVSNVRDMSTMFTSSVFNQPIGDWDVRNVTNMTAMFANSLFNQPIGGWNVASVVTMDGMFEVNVVFNEPIGGWNVSNVTSMRAMFERARAFNQPIGAWNVSKVTNMTLMLAGALVFNQPIGSWNTANVTNMNATFASAASFNQDISGWDVRRVSNMIEMFQSASSFNRNLGGWCVESIPTEPIRFALGADAWTQPKPVWGTCPTP